MGAITELIPGTGDTSNTTSYASGSFTPTAGDLLVILCPVGGSVAAGSATASANGITFTRLTSFLFDATSSSTYYVYVSDQLVPSSPSSMTVTVLTTGDAGTGAVPQVVGVSGLTRTGVAAVRQFASRSSQTAGTTLAVTLSAACLTGNPVLAAMVCSTSPPAVTQPSTFTEVTVEGTMASPTVGTEFAYKNSGFTSATVTWGSNSSSNWSAVVIEFDTSNLDLGTFGIPMA